MRAIRPSRAILPCVTALILTAVLLTGLANPPVTRDLLYWLDASDTNTVFTNAVTGEAVYWKDKTSNNVNFTNNAGYPYPGPAYMRGIDSNDPKAACPICASTQAS